MLRLSRLDRITTILFPILIIAVAAVVIPAIPVQAQLTEADIERLREQGKREGWTFEVGLSEATRNYSLEQLCGFKPTLLTPEQIPRKPITFTAVPPTRWDWRDFDGVSPVRDQKACGACWAFAICAPLEAAIRIKDGLDVDLSEQWLVSCNVDEKGCSGGNFLANDYHLDKDDDCGDNGAVKEMYFPYVALDVPCSGCPYPHDYWIEDWAFIDNPNTVADPDDMKQVIMDKGPIMVAFFVNDAFQSYAGGIFNGCENGPDLNHAVTIVGWDDDFEGSGESVWIVKNSWGVDWGVDGYFYMPFGCSRIGCWAAYIEYDLPGFMFWADTTIGWAPFDVNFDAFTHLTVDSWTWDFGDGEYAYEQTPPTHTYDSNGTYDVSLEIDVGGEIRSLSKEMYIIAIADTAKGDTVSASPDSHIEVVINANNTAPVQYLKIPFEFYNDFGMMYDSFSTVGCRTEYFEFQDYADWNAYWGSEATAKLITSEIGTAPDLEAGSGPVLKLYFTIPDTATIGQSATIELDGYETYLPSYYGDYANYEIATINGRVLLGTTCCMVPGDVNHSGVLDILDIDYFIDWLFRGGPEIPCLEEGNADGEGSLTILDIDHLIGWLYTGGAPPQPCP